MDSRIGRGRPHPFGRTQERLPRSCGWTKFQRNPFTRRLAIEPLESRRLLAVRLILPGNADTVSLTENVPGATPVTTAANLVGVADGATTTAAAPVSISVSRAVSPLTINNGVPTSVNPTQSQWVHPGMVYVPGGYKDTGYKYFMLAEPYPNGDSRYEQVSLLATNDPVHGPWVAPPGNAVKHFFTRHSRHIVCSAPVVVFSFRLPP